jgi:hypothetical protein
VDFLVTENERYPQGIGRSILEQVAQQFNRAA